MKGGRDGMAYQRKARGKPQVPGGYVDVPRYLYDAIVAAPFTLAQLKAVLVIARLTWGYYPAENHGGVAISQAAIAKYSGLSRWTVKKAMPSLVAEGVVEVVRHGAGRSPDELRVCTRPSQWGCFEPVAVYGEVPLEELSTGDGDNADPDGDEVHRDAPQRCTSMHRTGVRACTATGSHELPFLELPFLELPSVDFEEDDLTPLQRRAAASLTRYTNDGGQR